MNPKRSNSELFFGYWLPLWSVMTATLLLHV